MYAAVQSLLNCILYYNNIKIKKISVYNNFINRRYTAVCDEQYYFTTHEQMHKLII